MKGAKAKADTRRTDSRLKSKGAAAAGKKQSKKAAKDPNKPKRPASAFFVFMEEFRKQYAKEHPNNKAVSAVGKAGGEKWKSMSESVSIFIISDYFLVQIRRNNRMFVILFENILNVYSSNFRTKLPTWLRQRRGRLSTIRPCRLTIRNWLREEMETMRKSPTSPSLKCTMMRMKRTRAARMKMMTSRLTCMEGREPLV